MCPPGAVVSIEDEVILPKTNTGTCLYDIEPLTHPISSAEQISITLLFRANQYWKIIEDHVIRGNGLTAIGYKLGYLLSSTLETSTSGKAVVNMFRVATLPTPTPDLEQLWNVESVGITPTLLIVCQMPRWWLLLCPIPMEWQSPFSSTKFSTCAYCIRTIACKLVLNPSFANPIQQYSVVPGTLWVHWKSPKFKYYHKTSHHAVLKDSSA